MSEPSLFAGAPRSAPARDGTNDARGEPPDAVRPDPKSPLLRGAARERALAIGVDIGRELLAHYGWESPMGSTDGASPNRMSSGADPSGAAGLDKDPSLARGRSGAALLLGYLGRFDPHGPWRGAAVRALSEATDLMAAKPLGPWLYFGTAGLGFALTHLSADLADDIDHDAADGLDAAVEYLLQTSPWPERYELLQGLVGLGVYALERLPRASAARCVEGVVARLSELAEARSDGVRWWTPARQLAATRGALFPDGCYDLGLAHGVPGVIALLSRVYAAGLATEDTERMLRGAAEWVLAQRGDSGTWPAYQGQPYPVRSAWCYGDLSVASALDMAGRSLGEPTWTNAAFAAVRAAAARSVRQAGVMDAGLCHGGAGLGHIFHRFYRSSGDESLRDAAVRWFEWTASQHRADPSLGTFTRYNPGPDGHGGSLDWIPGFLEGSAGVGLALLSACADIEPGWDRLLLLS